MATPTIEKMRSAMQYEEVARQSQQKRDRVNLGRIERWLSGLGGGTLLGYGIVRRDWIGAAMAAVGGALVARGQPATVFCTGG